MNASRSYDESLDWVRRTQEQTLWELVRAAEGTALGRARGLRRVESTAEFQRRIPLVAGAELIAEPQYCMPGPLLDASTLAARQREAVSRLVVAQLGIHVRERNWFDLRSRFASRPQAAGSSAAATLNRWLDDVSVVLSFLKFGVVMGPTSWLCGILARMIAARGASSLPRANPSRGSHLRLLIATAPRDDRALDLLQVLTREVAPDACVGSCYEVLPGVTIGLRLKADTREYALLPDAGHFLEFVPVSAGRAPQRVPTWELRLGVTYELCVSTGQGLLGYRSGRYVQITGVLPYRFVPAELDPLAEAEALAGHHPHTEGSLDGSPDVGPDGISERNRNEMLDDAVDGDWDAAPDGDGPVAQGAWLRLALAHGSGRFRC